MSWPLEERPHLVALRDEFLAAFPRLARDEVEAKMLTIPDDMQMPNATAILVFWASGLSLQRMVSR